MTTVNGLVGIDWYLAPIDLSKSISSDVAVLIRDFGDRRRGARGAGPGQDAMVRTTRKRALPLIMRSYASVTRSSGFHNLQGAFGARNLHNTHGGHGFSSAEFRAE
jgi:hypothetical protein